jgi:hypothetical protein
MKGSPAPSPEDVEALERILLGAPQGAALPTGA